MFFTPEDGAAIASASHVNRTRSAAIELANLAPSWLRGADPYNPHVQRDAAIEVVETYHRNGVTPNAESVRDGVRSLLGVRGPQAIEAALMGLRTALLEERVQAEGVGTRDVRYTIASQPQRDQGSQKARTAAPKSGEVDW